MTNTAKGPFFVYDVQGSTNPGETDPTVGEWLMVPSQAEEEQIVLGYLQAYPGTRGLASNMRALAAKPVVYYHKSVLKTYRKEIAQTFMESGTLARKLGDLLRQNMAFFQSQSTATPERFSRHQLDEIRSFFAQFELELLQKSKQGNKNQGSWQAAAAGFRLLMNCVRRAEGRTLEEFLSEDPMHENTWTIASDLHFTSYPNPFNPSTTISYKLAEAAHVVLRVYDIVGREVRTLVDTHQQAGLYSLLFDGTALGSGLYFAKLETQGQIKTLKLLLVK